MIRKLAAIGLFVSFLAMPSLGMMMFVIEKPSFTIQIGVALNNPLPADLAQQMDAAAAQIEGSK